MPWNKNEGPWGSSSGSTSGGKSSGPAWSNKGSGGQGGGMPPPPDFDKFFREWSDRFQRFYSQHGGPSKIITLAFAILVSLWLLTGFYQVATDQIGVVMRFGGFNRLDNPGLRYHLPFPIETVLLPNVTSQNEITVGFRHPRRTDVATRPLPEESMMLTQDENIIDVQFAVFWRINDIHKFLFEIRDPESTVKMGAESAMREVIGQNKLQYALTDGREQIATDARDRLQKLMDAYNAGVVITQINLQTVAVPDEVKAAFQDVVNARLDQERFQNEAEAHANKVVPEANGEASKITQAALGYRDQKIALAKGEADRFKQVLAAYNMSHEITSKRLYLETMESVLGNAHKVILDKSGGGNITYLPLPDFSKQVAPEGGSK